MASKAYFISLVVRSLENIATMLHCTADYSNSGYGGISLAIILETLVLYISGPEEVGHE